MVDELLDGYSDYLKANGIMALYTYRSNARLFLAWLSSRNISLDRLTPRLLNDYLCYRKSSGRRYQTLEGDLGHIRHFLRHARQQGLISHDPTKDVSCRWLDFPGGYPAYQGALREILYLRPAFLFSYRLPLFDPDWEEFLKHLGKQSYSKYSIRNIAWCNRDFHRYLTSIKLRRITQITSRHLKSFLEHRQDRYRKRHRHPPCKQFVNMFRGAITLFLNYAGKRRKLSFHRVRSSPKNSALSDTLVERYLDFCRDHKGLRPATLESRLSVLTKLRRFLRRRKIRAIQAASILDYDLFLMDCAKSWGANSLFTILGTLRCFLRYLYMEETISSDLAGKLISPCRFSSDLRPKYLPWSKVLRMLAGIDRSTITGKRDYAILTLQAYHGLRAREAAKLAISDIEWGSASLLLRDQKNSTTSRIPLSQQAREALQDYLALRPDCSHPEVFLTIRAPLKPLGENLPSVAYHRLHQCFGRLLIPRGTRGVLRHSFAKLLLDRKAKLSQIMVLMRHKSARSTQTYTRVATEDLREVADNYANWLAVGSDSAPGDTGTAAAQ